MRRIEATDPDLGWRLLDDAWHSDHEGWQWDGRTFTCACGQVLYRLEAVA